MKLMEYFYIHNKLNIDLNVDKQNINNITTKSYFIECCDSMP